MFKRNMKILVKIFLKLITFPIASIYVVFYKIFKFDYKTTSIMISKLDGWYGKMARRNYYKMTLKKCGNDLVVHYGAFIVYPDVEIGDRCSIEEFSIVSLCKIGNDVIIAARCSLMSGAHHHDVDDIENTFYKSCSKLKKITLGDNLWIGTHSVIMEDVSSHTAVAAGAVVTKKFPEYSVIGGVPARLIKVRGKVE